MATIDPTSCERPSRVGCAAVHTTRIALAFAMLGFATAALVIARLIETWRVGPPTGANRVSIFGQSLSYPAANAGAILVLVLGIGGLVVVVLALLGAARELAGAARLDRRLRALEPRPLGDGARVIEDPVPHAFCAGLFRPRVYVSTGAVATLDADALSAVLAHEHHHAANRDPLRLATARVLERALFFLPALRTLVRQHREMLELSADQTAMAHSPAARSALARAMLAFAEPPAGADAVGVGVASSRVDALLGRPPRARFPLLVCLISAGLVAVLAAAAVLAGNAAAGSATLAVPFLSRQPCIVVLALLPAAGCLWAAHRIWRSG